MSEVFVQKDFIPFKNFKTTVQPKDHHAASEGTFHQKAMPINKEWQVTRRRACKKLAIQLKG
jgi:hypothetical protein